MEELWNIILHFEPRRVSSSLFSFYSTIFSIFVLEYLRIATMNKLMNCIKKVLEKKEIKQTWLANKPGKSFHIVNSNVCNYRQPSLEVRFKITKSFK